MTIPLYDFGGDGPVIHVALANGFPPQTYKPLFEPLTAHYRIVSLLPRAMWPGVGAPPGEPGSWRELADDLLAGMHQHNLHDVIAVGHSFGAVVSLLSVLEEPGRFRALAMLDPTILPVPVMQGIQALRTQGKAPRIPLVEGALSRRNRFANAEEAYHYWRGKPLFKDWADDTVRLYAEGLTRPADDGDGVELAWPRAWEAYYYLSIYGDAWDDLPRLNGLLPTLVVQGGDTDTYVDEAARHMQAVLPGATHVTLSGYGHLFPQAAPDAARKIIEGWLKTL